MRKLLLITLLGIILLLPLSNGCDYFPTPANSLSSQFDIEITNIWSTTSFLITEVTINPKATYNGTTTIYLALFSKDGYYFGKAGAYTWTPQQLQLADSSERDINIINAMEKQRIRQIQLHIPISDKDAVACLADINKYEAELKHKAVDFLANAPMEDVASGKLPKELGDEAKMDNYRKIFNRYFTIKIVTEEEAMELDKAKQQDK